MTKDNSKNTHYPNEEKQDLNSDNRDGSEDEDLDGNLEDTENPVEVPKEVEQALETLPEKAREIVERVFSFKVTSRQSYSAPIPPPDHVAEYEKIRAGSAADIFAMARKEQDIKETAIKGQLNNERFTISVAFVGMLGLIVITGIFAFLGQVILPAVTSISLAVYLAIRAVVAQVKKK